MEMLGFLDATTIYKIVSSVKRRHAKGFIITPLSPSGSYHVKMLPALLSGASALIFVHGT